ncbi:MAG: SDR family oxidoreductase [Nitriliruptoraceae bacterium]
MTEVLTALVTGGGSGIGRVTVGRLLDAGYEVATIDMDPDGLEATAQIAADAGHGDRLHTVVGNLASIETIDEAVTQVMEAIGPPDLLVNNAGIGVAGTAIETSTEDWDRTIAVNLSAVFHLCRIFVPRMIERGGGVIVNVSSVAGVVGVRNRAAYCASKAGVIGLTRALAADHAADGLRVNAICPGTVATEWIDRILSGVDDPEGTRAQMAARQLDGKMGTPEEVAAGIMFLASPEARFVNGSAFVMDGGMSAV